MNELKEKLSALPICFGRNVISELLPGLISPKSLANLAWRGVGGPPFYKMGRKVYYEKSSFIEWLINRTR